MTDIIEHMEWRYAVKKFDSTKSLSKEKVQKLKEAFNLTATSYGLQPIKMVVVKDKELRKKLVVHTYGQLQVAHASHLLVLCIENMVDSEFIANYFERVQHVRGTSDQILNPYKEALVKNFSSMKKAEIKQWAINQAYLALGNLMTVCAFERIDSCPMEGFDPAGYDSLLGLDEKGLTSVLVMPIGYRADNDMFSEFKKVRRGLKDSVIEI
ncbi:NAD(P)H-dependent oxidoreductase [Flavobacteriaceae bacterium F89]|uniref:NAD(P)H-dependent oxidoreductase n=1 Tax=Cerina litoralis TaxID=2874477 RepID=A0AAE3EWM4_9FLAO|nr:NAD(P)H-dependent oxidoreductase [Cerina litoralis]MCG2461016.1 NAD(P)H-dependent oxidoreductase [Cerina litoralis]